MSSESPFLLETLRANLSRIQLQIEEALQRSGRESETVRLLAVTKYAPMEAVHALLRCGHVMFGENRPQQLVQRASLIQEESSDQSPSTPLPEWHLIGQLQSNKIRRVLPWVSMIHSVDSLRLLQRISRVAEELELTPRLLLQVNVSGEATKGGFSPDQLRTEWETLCGVPHVELCGLMTMAPFTDDDEVVRRTFRDLRELRFELEVRTPHQPLNELSMGMSHDFQIAVEEGATIVRIGSLLFEGCESA